jgi:tetratricopeptide (TPR) repeat protein
LLADLPPDSDARLPLWYTLSEGLRGKGLVPEALEVANRRLELAERLHGHQSPEAIGALSVLAGVYRLTDENDRAEALYAEVLASREARLDTEPGEFASDAIGYAGLMYQTGRYRESAELITRALSVMDEAGLTSDTTRRFALGDLARAHGSLGEPEKALPLIDQALELSAASLGVRSASYGVLLGNKAGFLEDLGRREEALALRRQSHEVTVASLGPDNPRVAGNLHNMGVLLHRMGKTDEARSAFVDALRIREKLFGPDHSSSLSTKSTLGAIEVLAGNLEEGLRLQLELVDNMERVRGRTDRRTVRLYSNIAGTLSQLDRLEEAGRYYEMALEASQDGLGPEHPSTAGHALALVNHELVVGNIARAEELLDDIEPRVLQEGALWVEPRAHYMNLRATVHAKREEYEPAYEGYLGAAEWLLAQPGFLPGQAAKLLVDAGRTAGRLGRTDKAVEHLAAALSLFPGVEADARKAADVGGVPWALVEQALAAQSPPDAAPGP